MKKRKSLAKLIGAGIALLLLCLSGIGVRYYIIRLSHNSAADMETGMWYILNATKTETATGETMSTRMRLGEENKVIVFFYGGGISTDEYTAAHPYIGKWSDHQTGFYASTLLGQIPEIYQIGLADRSEENPFRDWSIIVVPYTTGDFHIGDGEFVYTDENGEEQVLHHHGYQNYRAILDLATEYIGTEPEELLIAGYSAGGYAAAMLAENLMTDYFPRAGHVTVCVDSSLMLLDNWQEIASEVWQAPEEITEQIRSDNLVVDFLGGLYELYGDELTYLYIGSTRDGALSQYQAYYDTGVFRADNKNITVYEQNLNTMLKRLQTEVPSIGIYLFDTLPYSWLPRLNQLTQHTVLATNAASWRLTEGVSPLTWMDNAINGSVTSLGLDKLTE